MMKKSIILLFFVLSFSQAQILRDDFNRAASPDISGSLKWRRLLNLNDTSATLQLNSDSTVSPRNQLGPLNRGGAFWDSLLAGRFQVGLVLRHKNGNDGVPSFHLQVMNDSSWHTGDGYGLRFQANAGEDRFDIQRITGVGTDTPAVNLLATLNREFLDGDTLFFKIYPDGRKTAVYYSVTGERDSISVVDVVHNPSSWIAWIQGRVFSDPVRLDNFMLGPVPWPITAAAGPGGSIAPSGTVLVNPGDSLAFSITPDPGYIVTDVRVDTLPVGAVTNYTFTAVGASHTIEAVFDTIEYTITATAGPNGTITPSGVVLANAGTDRSFAVAEDPGYHVDSVVVDGANLGALTGYDFINIMANHSIAAYFSINTYTISASASGGGSISPAGPVSVAHGGSQSFSVTPNTGYHIDSVNVDGANQGAVAGYDFTNVTGDHSIAAYFSINKYAVTASASSGGSIFPFGVINVSHGDSASFAITPNTGSHIDSVVVDGVNQGALSFYPFTGIDADHTIDAWFSINTYTVTASASAGGSISPAGAVSVNYGANRSFTVAPEPGYHTDSVVVDGFNQGAVGAYNFLNVTADHAIAAYFSINTYTISASASAGGSISPAGAVIVNHGSSRSFTLAPDTGYHVDSIVVDGVDQGASAAYEFTNVTANHAIAAFFSLDTFTVTAYAGPNGSVAPAGVTTVAYGGSVAYTITPSTGYFIADLRVDSVSVGAVGSYTFTGVTKSHTIEALFSITQFTIGAAASAGGTISPAGLVGVNFGDDTNFTITPDTGYHVDSVLVDGVDAGPVTAYGFTAISADHAISAYFSIDVFTITASASAAGSIAPSGPVSVNYGSDRSFAVTPDTGCHIDSVVVDGVNLGPLAAYDFTGVKSNHAIAAYFSIDLFTVTATAGPNGSIIPPGVSVVPYGGSIGYTIVPDTGYYVVDVHADTVSVGPVASYTLSNVTSNHTIAATFAITSFTVTANASAGGSVSPQGPVSVNYGDSLTIAVTPDAGYHIDSVVVDGVNQGPVAGLDFIDVTANHTVAAFFSIDVFTIAASSTPGGSITPSGSVGVDYGSDGSFTIAPATGYLIDSVVVDGANVGPVTAYDFTNVTSNHSIRAYFSLRTFSVTATAGPNGAVTPSGISVVNYGDSLAFAITPDTGYHVDSVVVDGVNEGVTGAYTFTNITADHTIAAWFSITNFTINATASAGGSISPSGAVGVSYGASRAFTMLPNTGYHVDSVVVDGVNVGAAASYTFPAVTADHAIAAYFSINSYTITASAGAGGGISPSGTLTLVHGSSQAFIITPSTGYAIQDVLVDGVSIGQPASYTFTSLLGNHTIHAVFALRTFTVTALAGPDGSVTPAGTTTVNYGDSLKYTITPDPGSYIEGVAVDGLPVGVVSDYTFTNITSNHQISATFTSNAAPDAVTLVSPADGTVLPPAALSTMRFVWRRSYDADPGDLLKYVLTLTGPGVNFSSFEMTDTSVTLDLGGLAIVNNVTYRWTVRVTDGQVTVASPDSFDLMFDPTTEVGEGPGPLPKAYALGQNYPNPFNPATSIPFDLPERSDVSLTIYNVLGVKVMELAAGESMAAGSYDRKADFSGLPSGVYFYRIAALGESGALFERVMRLVLIR